MLSLQDRLDYIESALTELYKELHAVANDYDIQHVGIEIRNKISSLQQRITNIQLLLNVATEIYNLDS